MPDQNTQTVNNVGDVLHVKTIPALPVGSSITDAQGDVFTRVGEDDWTWERNNGREGANWRTHELVAEMPNYAPVRLTSLPDGASSAGTPDLFQQARIALRDRTGTEPDIEHVHQVTRIMEGGLTPAAAVSAWRLANQPAPAPMPEHDEQQAAEHEVAGVLMLVVVRGTDATTQLVVSADTTAGLARLRAHAALDNLLDGHGVSR